MKILIVTPSFNQGRFLRRTNESVLSQNIEMKYVILDGGSTDGSVDILKEYTSKARIIIGKGNGQADAIAKGFRMATGNILGWLNSDDMYLPGALAKVVSAFGQGEEFIYSHALIVDEQDKVLRHRVVLPVGFEDLYFGKHTMPQESTFFSRNLHIKCGGVNPSYIYAMDYDLWLRMARIRRPWLMNDYLACFRFHEGQKSSRTDLYGAEAEKARKNLSNAPATTVSNEIQLNMRKLAANIAVSGGRKTIADVIGKMTGSLPK